MKKAGILIIGAVMMIMLAGAGIVRAGDNGTNTAKPYPLDTCAVCGMKLGEMGKPVTFVYKGREIKVCDTSEQKDYLKEPDKYLKQVDADAAKLKK